MNKTALIESIDSSFLAEIRPGRKAEPGRMPAVRQMLLRLHDAAGDGYPPTPAQPDGAARHGKELLASKAIWTCVSCQTCVSRCPMKVDTPALIDRLRSLAKDAPGKRPGQDPYFQPGDARIHQKFGASMNSA